MRITGLSASTYETYSWCNWKYFLQTNLFFEDVSGPSAVQGHIAHKVLEILSKASIVKHRKDSKIWDVGYLWNICFNRYFMVETLAAAEIQDAKLSKICRGIYELLESEYTPINENTIAAEVKVNLPFIEEDFRIKGTDKHFIARGFIDRVDKVNHNTVEIIDYKTGTRVDFESKDRHKKGPDDLHKMIQPRLYHLAAKHMYPWAENVLVTFIYLVDGGPVTVVFTDEDAVETKELLRKRFKAIQANDDPQKNESWKCRVMCPFGKDGTCGAVWEEKEEYGIKYLQDKYAILNERKKMRR